MSKFLSMILFIFKTMEINIQLFYSYRNASTGFLVAAFHD